MRSEWISVHVLCGCEWAPAHVLPVTSSPPLCFFGSRIHAVSSKHFCVLVLGGLFVILPFLAKAAVICVRGPPLSGHALASNSLFVLNAWRESMDSSIHDPRVSEPAGRACWPALVAGLSLPSGPDPPVARVRAGAAGWSGPLSVLCRGGARGPPRARPAARALLASPCTLHSPLLASFLDVGGVD